MALVLSLKSSYNKNSPKEIIFDALHFTIRAAEGVPKAKFTKLCTFDSGLCL